MPPQHREITNSRFSQGLAAAYHNSSRADNSRRILVASASAVPASLDLRNVQNDAHQAAATFYLFTFSLVFAFGFLDAGLPDCVTWEFLQQKRRLSPVDQQIFLISLEVMKIDFKDAFSYRRDPAVPDFPDRGPVVFIDGSCALCSAGARAISRFDRKDRFRICPVQSPIGRTVLSHYGLDPDDPDSWLFLDEGRAYTSLDAFIRVAGQLGGPWHAVKLLRILPRVLQDRLYALVARNRYRLFGRADICAIRDERLTRKLIL